ncbi:MAG: hypothetical protein AB7H93_09325 [Vicinamibacterales bacterium]
MKRRTLITSALGAMALRPGRAAAQAAFGDAHLERMRALVEAVLPQEIGEPGRQRALTQFMTWVRDYRADADGDHGYGHVRPRRLPPSPALKYPAQLDDLDRRAGGSFAGRPLADRQRVVAEAIDAVNVRDLPGRPNGAHVATDLMAHYFNGPGANDLAYGRSIMRGACRDLDGSDQRPAPLPAGGR